MKSINASRQILNPNYVTGLADGEGSFCVSLSPRPKLKVKWEVRPSFSLSQNFRSRGILYQLKDFFGCGSVRESKSDQTWKYEVRSLNDLIDKIVSHFQRFPLKTSKQTDFEIFEQVLAIMKNNGHLNREGLNLIFIKIKLMNPSGKRKYQNLAK
jgi:hypothetical protein